LPSVDIFDVIDAIEKVDDWLGWAAEVTGEIDLEKPLPSYPEQSAFASQLVDFINEQTALVQGIVPPELAEPVPSTNPPAGGSFDTTRDDLANRGVGLQLAASELLDHAGLLNDLKLAIGKVATGKSMMLRLSEMFMKFASDFPPGVWTELFVFKSLDLGLEARRTRLCAAIWIRGASHCSVPRLFSSPRSMPKSQT
jgi:hypothetical protein